MVLINVTDLAQEDVDKRHAAPTWLLLRTKTPTSAKADLDSRVREF